MKKNKNLNESATDPKKGVGKQLPMFYCLLLAMAPNPSSIILEKWTMKNIKKEQ